MDSSQNSPEAPARPAASRLGEQGKARPEGRSALRLLILIILAIITANATSLALTSLGLPLSRETGLLIHTILTVALLFGALYLFSVGPLALKIRDLELKLRELELRREELLKNRADLDQRLAQSTAQLQDALGKAEEQSAHRQQVELEVRRLHQEIEQRVHDRTSQLETANHGLHSQIAELRKAADVLRESEKRYRRLVEIAPEGVWTINAQGRTNFVNRHAADLLGYSVPEMLGHAPVDFMVAEDLPRELRNFDLQRTQAASPLEFRLRRKDGHEVWVRASISAISGDQGDYLGALLFMADTTARRESERRLQDQLALIDVAPDAFVLCDADWRILSWNQGATRLYGWSADEAMGHDFIELTQDKAAPMSKDELREELQTKNTCRGELNQQSKDGRRLIVDARITPAPAGPGGPGSLLIVTTDMTQKKRLEAQTLQEQRMESAGALASGLAQELNNILAPVLLSTQMLRSKRLEREDLDLVTTLEASAERTADLLRQALVFARGIEGERVLIQPDRLVRDMTDIAREMFPRNIQVFVEVQPGIWNVKGDSSQLHQILLRLCAYARDAMPHGGTLRLKARNNPLDPAGAIATGLKPASYVLIQIQHSGAGIPAPVQDRVFEPFAPVKEGGQNCGLGLATALGIVRSHGGTIQAHNLPTAGSTFDMYLPAAVESTLEKKGPPVVERPAGRGELILMVEDEAALREVTRRTLSRNGYEVVAANDGAEALGLLTQHHGRIRLVLTNMTTSSMDGPALARAARKIDPRIRIIASSGLGRSLGQAEKLAALQSLGISRVLAKPYSADELLRAIREELSGAPSGNG